MSNDTDSLTAIARTLLRERTTGAVSVVFDNTKETCTWNYPTRTMTLSNKVLPKVLIGAQEEYLLMTGAVVHEAGHPIYTADLCICGHDIGVHEWSKGTCTISGDKGRCNCQSYTSRRIQKIRTVANEELMHDAINIVLDSSVNYWMQLEWGETIARRLKALLSVIGKGMLDDIDEDMKAKKETDPVRVMLAMGNFSVTLEQVEFAFGTLPEPIQALVLQGVRCMRQAKTVSSWEDLSSYCDEMYRVLTKLINAQQQKQSGRGQGGEGKDDETEQESEYNENAGERRTNIAGRPVPTPRKGKGAGAADSIPTQMGGKYEVRGGKSAEAEAKAQAKAAGEGDSTDGEGSDSARAEEQNQPSRSVGYDPNARVPTPQPDLPRLEQLVASNQAPIKAILDRLKKDVTVKLERDAYLPSGRIMPSMLVRAATMRNPPTDIYTRMRIQEEKEPTRWAILVDLSGSMDIGATMNTLVVLSEVASKYLRDDQFSLYVFGSDFYKLKSFYESYENVRARIGGLVCLGGTWMQSGLEAITKEFNSFTNGHRNRIIIVSDFALADQDDAACLRLLEDFLKKPKSKVMLLDMAGYRDTEMSKRYTKRHIRSIDELPDVFIETYVRDTKDLSQ